MSAKYDDGLYDVVVVGGGPRALCFALADLEKELARIAPTPNARLLSVMVLEPGTPGAGAVWEPSQPTHLLMNVDARIVDATCPSVEYTFQQWRQEHDEAFPPRAVVGSYLAWSFERLRASPYLRVEHRTARASEVRREGDVWECVSVDDHGEKTVIARSHRVLLATGHAGGAGIDHAAMADPSRGPAPRVPVLIRGAALTAFDVVMDLTGGRGGIWVDDADAVAGLRYVASGKEPSTITLVSRSGEPMLPKPVSIPVAVTDAVRKETSGWVAGAAPDDEWWNALADGAVAAASAAGTRVSLEELWLRLDESTTLPPDARWDRDVARALGELDGDPAWWWGRAWSAGYADVVRSLERAPRDEALWTRWRARAATLERWAFGPPLVTHRRLLALRDAGLLRVVRNARGDHELSDAVTVDAFTRGPGVRDDTRAWDNSELALHRDSSRAPWHGLLADGLVTVRPGERGVFTAPDATCIRADGELNDGLAALGRPTEDPVIGHDSLQRHLHGDSGRWAIALAAWWHHKRSAASTQLTGVGAHD